MEQKDLIIGYISILFTAMTPESILTLIIAITVIGYVFEQVLDLINLKHQRQHIPDEVGSFYDHSKYAKSLAYHRELTKFSFLTSAFGLVLSLTMLLSGGFGILYEYLQSVVTHEIMRALIFFGILMLAGDLFTLPFQIYSVFGIEQKYGFNKTTARTFVMDKLKGYVLSALIGGTLMSVLLYLIQWLGQDFWIWFAAIAAVFMLLINMFYTSLILPMFNTLTPLPDGILKDSIKAFSNKVTFPLENIYVIDGSKRSSKANAFFSGLGKRKKIVLYDTLINNHSTEELVAVLAHEVGHFKKKHIVVTYFLSILQIVVTLFVLSLLIFNPDVSAALGASSVSIPVNLVAFGILYSPVSAITGLLMNMISRKNEYEADRYATETHDGNALADALKKLSVDNLSNLYPHPLYVFFHYSHPPLLKRLAAIRTEVLQ